MLVKDTVTYRMCGNKATVLELTTAVVRPLQASPDSEPSSAVAAVLATAHTHTHITIMAETETLECITEHERILQEIESTDTACVGPTLR